MVCSFAYIVLFRSRVMAISAAQKFFAIFPLKPAEAIRSEMENGSANPIQNVWVIQAMISFFS